MFRAFLFAMFLFTAPVVPDSAITLNSSAAFFRETECLTQAIYREAAEEPYEGKLGVATVVMNRTKYKEFGTTICGVVYQRSSKGCQFSWVCSKKLPPIDSTMYAEARRIALQAITEGKRQQSIGNALFFHNTSVNPNWEGTHVVQQIGHQIFHAVNTRSRDN